MNNNCEHIRYGDEEIRLALKVILKKYHQVGSALNLLMYIRHNFPLGGKGYVRSFW